MGTAKKFAAICILCIAGCAREYADEQVCTQLPEGKHPVVWSMELGKSVEARAIRMHVFGERGPVVLFFGGMHGDEMASQHVALCLVDYLLMHEELYAERRVAVITTLNPDGIARRTRVNANGVDVNRNFPTQDWREGKRNKFYGGPEAASEPETRALMGAVDALKPLRVVSIHVAVGIAHCIEFDGPVSELAHAMAAHNGYPVKEEMGYPTPGCFGFWVSKECDIPEITLELQDHRPGQKLWPEHRDALIAAIVFGLDNQQGRQSPKNDYPEATDDGGWGEPVKGLRCRWIGPKGTVFVEDNPEISMEVENVSDKRIFWECLDDCGLAVIEPGSAGRSIRLLRFKVRFKQGARQATAPETRQHFHSALPGHYCLEPGARMALTSRCPWPLAKAGPTKVEGYLFRENPLQGRDFPYPEGLILCPPLVVEVVAQDLSHLEDDILQMISLKADQIRQLNKTLHGDRKLAAKFDIPKKDLATTPSDVLCKHFFAVSPLRVWFGMYDDRNMGITRAIRGSSTLGTLFGREDIIPAIIKVYQETPLDPEKMQDLDPGTTSMSLMTIDEFLIYPPVFEKVAGYEKQILSVLCDRYRKMERVNSSRADDPLYGAIYSSTKNLTLLLLERVRPSLYNSLVREREYSKLFAQVENVAFDPEFKDITTEDYSLKLDSPARRSKIGAAHAAIDEDLFQKMVRTYPKTSIFELM